MGPVTVRSNFVQGEIAQVSLQKLCAPQPWMTRSNKSENAVEPRCEQAGGGQAESESSASGRHGPRAGRKTNIHRPEAAARMLRGHLHVAARKTLMPSFYMRECSVDRLRPRRAAAPLGPAIFPIVFSRAATISCRSASSRVARKFPLP